jgi:RNA polymerase sigma-70 factor
MSPEITRHEILLKTCSPAIDELFAVCNENAPNFGVEIECFREAIEKTIRKYLFSNDDNGLSKEDLVGFINEIQAADLFLAMACSNGNERSWWEFDQNHRGYLERVARHLARTEVDAQDVVDTVYVELYGTRVVEGERVSKFASYSGKGSLRGWLRTVVWHSLVDLHRTSHDEVSLDEMTENLGEGLAHASFAEPNIGGEETMLDQITVDRYRKVTVSAIENAFGNLENHEKLLLFYYHVENLKLREISKLVQEPESELRSWFQRKSANREQNPDTKIHESTVMRWLEKTYSKVLKAFKAELQDDVGLKSAEFEICMQLATRDLASQSLYKNLLAN